MRNVVPAANTRCNISLRRSELAYPLESLACFETAGFGQLAETEGLVAFEFFLTRCEPFLAAVWPRPYPPLVSAISPKTGIHGASPNHS